MKVSSQKVTFGALLGAGDDGPHHLEAGGVAQGVNDAAMAVAAFARQGEMAFFLVEMRAPADQVVDLLAAPRGPPVSTMSRSHRPPPAVMRVLDMVLEAILRRQHAGDAALGVGAVALLEAVLGDDEHVEVRGHLQRGPQAGDAGADDEDVGENVRRLLGIELHQIAVRHAGVLIPFSGITSAPPALRAERAAGRRSRSRCPASGLPANCVARCRAKVATMSRARAAH